MASMRKCASGRSAGWLAASLGLLILAVGCCPKSDCRRGFSPIADTDVELPESVKLPPGCYPLVGHYDSRSAEDSYNGWPRYIVSTRDDMVMAYVPAQTIIMGGGAGADEVPARHVNVPAFYIDLHEVSNAQFNRFYLQGPAKHRCPLLSCKHPIPAITADDADYEGAFGCPGRVSNLYTNYWRPNWTNHHPVRNVSWWEANSYATWAGKHLPTEAEWEAAARGSDNRRFPWGNEERSEVTRYLCNAQTGRGDFDGYEYTAPVMNFAGGVSPFGAFQMAGNVAEWCDDWYDPSRYAYPSSEDPASVGTRGPKAFGDRQYPNPMDKITRDARVGPLRGGARVVRGGSFADSIDRCRVDARDSAQPDAHMKNVGFRCVLPL